MKISNKNFGSLWIIALLFFSYLILKWTCRLIFGLLDYALLIVIIGGIIWYLKLPTSRKAELRYKATALIKKLINP
ncbi:MAG: hypothetical protein HDS95_05615 [Bacteroidales bacterium]|nr:hypothetical protein [Bacteroidales bacterium]